MPEVKRDYFFDTVTLSNFALAGCLELLTNRFGSRLRVTTEVMDELSAGVVAGYAALRDVEGAVLAGRIRSITSLSSAERATFRDLLRVLSPGEASCIACALSCRGIVVTDDMAARECCAERSIRCTGTVGILKACVNAGVTSPTQADAILQAMIDAGYHSPVRRISDLLPPDDKVARVSRGVC